MLQSSHQPFILSKRVFATFLALCGLILFSEASIYAGEEDYKYLRSDKNGVVTLCAKDLQGTMIPEKFSLGILHSGVWKWKQGDLPNFASPSLDDSQWRLVQRISSDSVNPDWQRIFWLRSHIRIDSALRYTSVAMLPYGVGAMEFFLNGQLVGVVGQPSDVKSDETPIHSRGKPFILQFGAETDNVLAVRYSFHAMPLGLKVVPAIRNEPFLGIGFAPVDEALKLFRAKQTHFSVRYLIAIGMMLALCLLHCALFLLNRSQRFHLLYSVFTLLVAVRSLTVYVENIVEPHPGIALLVSQFSNIYNTAIPLICWLFFYSLFGRTLSRRRFWIGTMATFVVIIGLLVTGGFAHAIFYDASMVVILALSFDAARIAFQALRKREPGAAVMLVGISIFGLMWTLRWFVGMNWFPLKIDFATLNAFVYFGYLSVPLAMSLYIALVVSRTQRSLQEQIVQVQELSERALEQERRAKEAEISRSLLEADNERKTRELEEARALQLSMLPHKLPEHPRFEIAAFMRTATEVGGDYYDFRLSEDGKTLIAAVGDATGHGMKAGYLVSTTKSYFQTLARESNGAELLTRISHGIKNMNLRGMYMCLGLVRCESTEQGTVRAHMAIAGMPPVLIYRATSKSIEQICVKALPLGSITNFEYREVVTTLETDDVLLLMSDGLPELFNAQMETLDMERIVECFQSIAHLPPSEIMNALQDFAETWTEGASPLDDMTMVVMKVLPVPKTTLPHKTSPEVTALYNRYTPEHRLESQVQATFTTNEILQEV
jgi:serine phosphatase RsbU (regulator of sigma subunit)